MDRGVGAEGVLKIAQVLLAEGAVVRRDPLAVVGVLARLHLVDEIPHDQRVGLVGAKHQRLVVRIDLTHEDLDEFMGLLLKKNQIQNGT